MKGRTEAMADSLHGPAWGGDIERAGGPNGHLAHIRPDLFTRRDHGPHDIPGLEAVTLFGLFGAGARKAEAVHEAQLAAAVAAGLDQQGPDRWIDLEHGRRTGSDARCISPVGLGQTPAHPIELGEAAAAALHGPPGRRESLKEQPARAIDYGSILQRRFGLSKNLLQHVRLLFEEERDVLGALAAIAGLTGQTQITDPITAAVGTGLDVLNLEGHAFFAAIGTSSLPLLQQPFTLFIASECSLLILHALNGRVFHRLQVEPDQLHADRRDGTKGTQTLDPRLDVEHAAEQGGSQPALRPAAIGIPGLAVAGVACSAAFPDGASVVEGLLDGLSSVGQFRCKKHAAVLVVH